MTDFIVAMEVRVKADQAKAAFAGVKTDLAGVGTAAREASVDGSKLGPALQKGATEAAAALDKMEAELASLRAQLISVTSAEAAANRATEELAAKVAKLEAKLGKGGVGGAAESSSNALRGVTQQLSQVGQQTMATGNFLQALAIQLPDIGLAFGAVGTAAGLLAGIALPMLWSAFSTSGENAALAAEKTERLRNAYDSVAEAARATQADIDKLVFGVDDEYRVELLQEQIRLRNEYNAKAGQLNAYLSTTTDSLDRQKITAADLVAEITTIVAKYDENVKALADQENRATQLAILAGQRAQAEGEAAARVEQAAEAAERQHDAMVRAYSTYADTRVEGEALAEAAADAGVNASDLAAISFGNISGAANEAIRLAGNMGIALDVAGRLAALGPQGIGGNDPSGGTYSGRGRAPTQAEIVAMRAAGQFGYRTPPPATRSTGGRGGGGGGGQIDVNSFAALTAAAEKAMATLDASIAGINEKVRLGLMSTAEGTKAIASAKEQAAGSIAELIPKLEKASDAAGPKAAAAVAKWRTEVRGLVVDLGQAGSELSEKLSNNFEKGFAAFLTGAKSGKAAMADFKNFILQQMAEIAAQRFTSSIISPLIDGLLGGIFPGAAGGGGTGSLGLPMPFAKGGIPSGRGISAYSGTIVDQPTFFPMAKGAYGLMGEAGPEAVVPLARGADGKLGVRSTGGGGAPVTVNVINNAQGTKATARERQEGGMSIVDVMIEQVEAKIAGNIAQGRGPMPDALSGTYGLSRVGS